MVAIDAARAGRRRTSDTLLLGLGNDILTDDAVGLLAARRVAERIGDAADFAEGCVATIDLLSLISGYRRVVVVDALLSADLAPGSTVRATVDDLPSGFGYRSFHTLPFRDMIEIGNRIGVPMPEEIVVHGLVVEDPATFGETPTPAVEAAWRAWADSIVEHDFPGAAG